jgi:hypothetical protein
VCNRLDAGYQGKGKASRASKVTANYSLHSARSLGDRVMGLLDRPEATKGGVGKVKDTLRATYGQDWPYRTGAVGAVCFTDSLQGSSGVLIQTKGLDELRNDPPGNPGCRLKVCRAPNANTKASEGKKRDTFIRDSERKSFTPVA